MSPLVYGYSNLQTPKCIPRQTGYCVRLTIPHQYGGVGCLHPSGLLEVVTRSVFTAHGTKSLRIWESEDRQTHGLKD